MEWGRHHCGEHHVGDHVRMLESALIAHRDSASDWAWVHSAGSAGMFSSTRTPLRLPVRRSMSSEVRGPDRRHAQEALPVPYHMARRASEFSNEVECED